MNNNEYNINWYPGHMAKTKRLIKEKYDLIDIVYEVIDARMPKSSKIKDIDVVTRLVDALVLYVKELSSALNTLRPIPLITIKPGLLGKLICLNSPIVLSLLSKAK